MASVATWLATKLGRRSRTRVAEATPDQEQTDLRSLSLIANVPDAQMDSWENQAGQYPATGPPGISYFRGEVRDDLYVDCLLYRDAEGRLVGILNHYPTAFPPYEREGDRNIWVHPDRRRQGIGSALLLEAMFRWGPRESDGETKVTETGVEFLSGLVDKYGGSEYDFRAVGWDAWHERRATERENPQSDWRDVGWEVWHKRWQAGPGDQDTTGRGEDDSPE